MTVRKFSDQGFDDYRKERKRIQAKLGPQGPAHSYDNHALRELEQVEAREVRDQKLTREVHDFFAAATRQAASIVERVARDAQQEAGERVEQEMESFLIDSLTRMNTFILTVMRERRGVAETQMEPMLGNIVGASLDEFRWAGTASIEDKHIGQDPFETPVDEVQREFREQVGHGGHAPAGDPVPIDEHLVADVAPAEDDTAAPEAPVAAMPAPARAEPRTELPKVAPAPRPSAASTPAAAAAAKPTAVPSSVPSNDLDRFKEALKTLVRQGTMSRDEARIAWQTRVASLGGKV
jgi:hypothetical protein